MDLYVRRGQQFSVPVTVADHLLGLASHDQLKVLLYVLCHADTPLDPEQIVRVCKVPPEAIEEALVFWQDANILLTADTPPAVILKAGSAAAQTAPAPAFAAPAPVQQPVPVPQPAVQTSPLTQAAPPQKPAPHTDSSSAGFTLMPSEIAERTRQNSQLAEVIETAQMCAGKPLNHTELKSLIWMHEYLGLEPDILIMLVAFCVEIGAFQVRYMEQVAVEWQERGVTTHALVEEDISRRMRQRTFTGQIMKLFEMQKSPTSKQQSFIDDWQQNGYSLDLIRFAYEKTRNQNDDRLNFSYLNAILQRWKDSGITTVAQAEQADEAFYAARKKKSQGEPVSENPAKPADSSLDMDMIAQLMKPYPDP